MGAIIGFLLFLVGYSTISAIAQGWVLVKFVELVHLARLQNSSTVTTLRNWIVSSRQFVSNSSKSYQLKH
ncbi:hypothetical protein H6G17_08550 [Chroococcidiopsis sp. FACHB-1243]|uniref:hypothetical protein n=1 Tax=Chroococcidiopsis sp. [FACHB-1243] TaxID=2692781 RepID=UPI00177B3327|nr:hypothetical protein [Chroococcidiopsis sp. [FACHB-1243]]MBD2305564.1 hypothetical protein [Chroococcidiopsis sp. [FACHB-1243]]